MAHKVGKKESNSNHQKEAKKDEELWAKLKIDFCLEASVFLDNKIYGTIKITPKKALKLIKNFVLVTNDSTEVEFNCNFRKISASGFDPMNKDSWVCIKVIPENKELPHLEFEHQQFSIVRQLFPLTPTVNFDWPPSKNSKPRLNVRWFHLGDKIAQQYVLCLDAKEIHYIREPVKSDAYQVCINNLKSSTKHTLQIKARLNNGQETYQSDTINFTVPNERGEKIIQVINVAEQPDLTGDLSDTDDEEKPERKNGSPKQAYQRTDDDLDKVPSCACSGPHKSFPGISHYFNKNKPTPLIQRNPIAQDRTRCFDKHNTNDSDDDNQNQEEKDDDYV